MQGGYRHASRCGAATPAMKLDARSINAEYGRGKRSLARVRGRSPDRLKPLRDLYEGQSIRAHRFRYGLLAFDLVTVAFIVVTSSCRVAPSSKRSMSDSGSSFWPISSPA